MTSYRICTVRCHCNTVPQWRWWMWLCTAHKVCAPAGRITSTAQSLTSALARQMHSLNLVQTGLATSSVGSTSLLLRYVIVPGNKVFGKGSSIGQQHCTCPNRPATSKGSRKTHMAMGHTHRGRSNRQTCIVSHNHTHRSLVRTCPCISFCSTEIPLRYFAYGCVVGWVGSCPMGKAPCAHFRSAWAMDKQPDFWGVWPAMQQTRYPWAYIYMGNRESSYSWWIQLCSYRA